MGTRGLVIIKVDNNEYGLFSQYDSYIGGLGYHIINQLRSLCRENLEFYKQNIRDISWTKDNESIDLPAKLSVELIKSNSILGLTSSEQDIREVFERKLPVCNNIDFAKDTLFCEYIYTIDLDKEEFKICKPIEIKLADEMSYKVISEFLDSRSHSEYSALVIQDLFDIKANEIENFKSYSRSVPKL